MIRRVLAALITLLLAGVLLVAAWPQLFGLEQAPAIAQVVSLRGFAVAIAVFAVVVLLIIAIASSSARSFTGTVSLLLVIFIAVSLAVLGTRGFGGGGFQQAGSDSLRVLAWNTLGDEPGAQVIADLALESEADVVSLPETTGAMGVEIAEIMGAAGRPMWALTTAYDDISKARSTTVLISADLGEYTIDNSRGNTEVLPTVIAVPVNGVGPTIVAVHPVAPVPGEMANWQSDLTWLAGICGGENTILAGDFNSTLDHFGRFAATSDTVFGECHDAAADTGNAAVGTWPTAAPALLGAPIDHVMYTDNWTATGMRVITDHDEFGSDHRPILAQLTPTPAQ